jgi:regulatory protein YycI of two-component signal transduction system YycFG
MDWKNAKTILILMFLLLNVVLSVILYKNYFKVEEISPKTINNTKKILVKNNVHIECDIPKYMGNDYNLEYEEKVLNKEKIITKFLGENYEKSDKNTYVNGNKSLIFNNSSGFEFYDKGTNNELTNYSEADMSKYLKGLSQTLALPFDEFQKDGYYPDVQTNEGARIVYIGEYNDYPVFDNYIEIEVTKSGLKSLKYNYKKPIKITVKEDIKVIPSYQILITKMTNFPKIKISAVNIGFKGYTKVDEDTKTLYEGLSWRIKTSDGKVFYFNARNGERIK